MVKLKYRCKSFSNPIIQSELDTEKKEGLYPVYGASGIAGYKKDFAVDKDYLGIVKDGAGVGRINIYPKESSLLGTLAYIIPNSDTNISWLKYSIIALNLGENVDSTTIPHIYFSQYGNKYIEEIDIHKQKKLANYLDQQCAHIDTVIEQTKASIEEYRKLKQSVITQAVTKGVRGERPMKDSDNVWYSNIPHDVAISRVGLHFDIILGKMISSSPKSENMEEYPYFCAADVHFDGVNQNDLKRMWFTPEEIAIYKVIDGDLLVVEGGAGAGGCAIVDRVEELTGVQNSIQIVRPKKNHDVRYLAYLLQSLVKRKYIDVVCNKATIPHFTKDKLANVPYLVWDVEEQKEIADYLDKKCTAIDNLISKKEQFLTELENYKKSLIYEYVTGKKEVL